MERDFRGQADSVHEERVAAHGLRDGRERGGSGVPDVPVLPEPGALQQVRWWSGGAGPAARAEIVVQKQSYTKTPNYLTSFFPKTEQYFKVQNEIFYQSNTTFFDNGTHGFQIWVRLAEVRAAASPQQT